MPERRIGLVKQTFWISYHLDAVAMTKMTDSLWWIWAYTKTLGPNSDHFCCTNIIPQKVKKHCANEHDKNNLTNVLRDKGAKDPLAQYACVRVERNNRTTQYML
jgi:hypothetical protein|uniref:Uncharacterized protein n=1 Tax=Sipha flava TaxID=143950 RepID=A0A2S2QGG1_9HEMI